MANVTIKTNISGVTDSASGTLSYALTSVPNTSSEIITNRTFTPNTNCSFTKPPHISFVKTKEPNRYSYSVVKNIDGSYSFTVNYLSPLVKPTTDVIEFFAEAKTNAVVSGDKIYGWNIKTNDINPDGEARTLSVTGDPKAKLKISVTENPRIGPNSNASFMVKEFTATIGDDGVYNLTIDFPSTSLAVDYRIILTEFKSGTFTGGLSQTPTTIHMHQWPLQQTKLQIIDTHGNLTLPATTINNAFVYFSGIRGQKTLRQDFSFTVTHANNLTYAGGFPLSRFTQVTGQGSTLTDDTIPSIVTYDNLAVTIDNTTSPKSAVVSGQITITHGYDAGGHTYITLDANMELIEVS